LNVLYIYRHSDWGEELKYSLRSVEKYINPERVVIAGDKPKWLKNVLHVETERHSRYKDACNSLLKALNVISGDYVLMHDDIFLLKEYKPVLRYNGTLKDRVKRTGGERRTCLMNTLERHPEGTNYALHYPLPFQTETMRKALDEINLPFSYYNAYGNTDTTFEQIESEDCKFHPNLITTRYLKGLDCFSTYNETEEFKEFLEDLYPTKSKYEL
jgi:hypothetical protein